MRKRRHRRRGGGRRDHSPKHGHFWKRKDKLAANIIMRRDYSIHPPIPIIQGKKGLIGFHRKPIGVELDENITVEKMDQYDFGFISDNVEIDLMKDVTPIIMLKCIEDVYYLNICAMRERNSSKKFEIILGWELKIEDVGTWLTIFLGLKMTEIYIGYNCEDIVNHCTIPNFKHANFHPLDTLDVEYGVLQSIATVPLYTYIEATYKEILNGDTSYRVRYDDLTFNIDLHDKYTLTYISGLRTKMVYKTRHYPMKINTADLTDLITVDYIELLDWLDIDRMYVHVRGTRKGAMRFIRNMFIDKIGQQIIYGSVKEMWNLLVDKT